MLGEYQYTQYSHYCSETVRDSDAMEKKKQQLYLQLLATWNKTRFSPLQPYSIQGEVLKNESSIGYVRGHVSVADRNHKHSWIKRYLISGIYLY